MASSSSNINNQATKPISVETAELLRIEFQFEHTLPFHRTLALAQKYGLQNSQIVHFFKNDMKQQRDDEMRIINEKRALDSDVLVLPPKPTQQKKRMAKTMALTDASSGSAGSSTSAGKSGPSTPKPKKKVAKVIAKQILHAEFIKNTKLPASRKMEIAEKLGMEPEEVRKYFVNQRAKGIRQWVQQTTRRLPKFKF